MDKTPPRRTGFGVNGIQPESQFELRTLEAGAVLELIDGRQVCVIDNPHDGVWLVCDALDADGELVDEPETVLCYDIVTLVRRGNADG